MGKKKLISRALSALTTLALMLTCIPPNILTTFAAGGGGSGGGLQDGGGTASPVIDDAVNDEDVGLRFSLVTLKDGKAEVVKNIGGTYYFDVWSNAVTPPNYNNVNTTSRYSPLPSKGNITKATVASFDSLIKNYAATTFGSTVDFYLSGLLNPGSGSAIFTEANGGFGVYGQDFFNWFMGTGIIYNGINCARYELVMNALYAGCTAGLNPKNTFLVVEPIVNLCNVDNGWSTTGNRYVASWYGYLTYNISVSKDPGRAYTVRNRLKKIGNGFRLADTAFTADIEKRNKIQEVLGLSIATGDPYGNVNSPAAELFGSIDVAGWGPKMYNNIHETIGLGIQAFWLSGSITEDKTKDPIDTYDIIDQTKNTPTPPEEPSSSDSSDNSDTSTTDDVDTSGDKMIIKLYADLYKDPDTGYYTYIEDIESGDKNTPYAFIETDTSNLVSITNEEKINGYKASAWYTSKTQYEPNSSTNNALLKASNMIAVTDFASNTSDGKVTLDNFGGKQLRVDKYQPAYQSSNKAGYNSYEGCQKFFTSLPQPHGINGNGLNAQKSTGATNYTDYKRLETKGTSNYGTYDYPVNEEGTKIDLGDAETIIILYTREKIDISTSDLTTDETIPDTPDDRKDKSGPLTIVKLYGVINPNTYEITADPSKSSVVTKNATRNVNINSEPGYNFAEWIYVTGGAPTDLTAQKMGTTNLSNIKLDGTVDQAYRLDGFVDGFKNNANLEKYFRFSIGGKLQLPTINTISVGGVNSNTVAGRFSLGSRSGIGTGSYNSTLYLGGDKLSDGTADDVDNNDVLYLLFLKTDQLSYSSDDLVIPESYITRYDNYKHNPMTVTGSISGTTYDELLQQHKFRYVLPVVADGTEYIDVNPLFIPHIAKPSGFYFFALLQ